MATAEAKALGLRSGGGTDGVVSFDATAPWTFDPTNRAAAGHYDLIGVAEHEISEVPGTLRRPWDLLRRVGATRFVPLRGT
jgi:hypothetical protein